MNGDEVKPITKEDIELERSKWRGRRKMAWLSLNSMVFLTLILLFAPISETRLATLQEPLIWSYFCFTGVIAAYMGSTVIPNLRKTS
jgi:hypothetical protein